MRLIARNKLITTALLFVAANAWSQMTAEGLWKTIDDDTGEVKSLVRIEDGQSGLTGKVEKILDPTPARTVCDLCKDERKDQPILGLTIIKHATADEAGEMWTGGEILDPNNGKTYRLELKPMHGGKQLRVRGYWGPFYRTQVWHRQ